MAVLTWDEVGERRYETGVDHGVLYIPDGSGVYDDGVAWNGLVSFTETPSGAEPNNQYADNIKYLVLTSAEEFGGTLEAFTYPDEFNQFDGNAVPTPGVTIGQQSRGAFGLSYRTKIGNDIDGTGYGYKLHLLWGCVASPSEKAYTTINDSPEAITFSWELTTLPVNVTGYSPTALMTIDSTKVDPAILADLEDLLYGTAGTDPSLPTPDEVIAMFAGDATATNVVVTGDVDSIDITGTTTNVLFTVEQWNGSAWEVVVGGEEVNEAAAEALTLTNGVKKVSLSGASGFYVPAAQANPFYVNVT